MIVFIQNAYVCSEMSVNTKLAIIGGGSWATALLKIACENTTEPVQWWVRSETDAQYIQEYAKNPKYLSSVEINLAKVNVNTDLQQVIWHADLVILAVPSAFLAKTLDGIQLPKDKIYVSAVKGIDPQSRQVIARWLQQTHGIDLKNIGLITGPCHAEEVALEKLSYLTISALDETVAKRIEKFIACRYINTKINNDLIGAEYAAVLKNIYAIGGGIAHGLGYGDNYFAVYVGAALREMDYFLETLHEAHRDVKNAAYLGDLLVTCYSQFSRNRTFGNMLGKGYSVKSAQLEMNMVAEGYYATESVEHMRLDLKIEMPIVKAIYDVVYNNKNPKMIFDKLAIELE